MVEEDEMTVGFYDSMDGPSEEEVYLSGKSFSGNCRKVTGQLTMFFHNT
jgi:hypothetical protein